jgi:cytochrome P450/NADPH-cytochrome P450 reductase
MYTDMMDIASQLVLKWERFGPEHVFDATEDFTRLAFDTISLCAMGHRLNSFYTDRVPEFVQAMGDFLKECYHRPRRLKLVSAFMTSQNAKWEADAEKMTELCSSSKSIKHLNHYTLIYAACYSYCCTEGGWRQQPQRPP